MNRDCNLHHMKLLGHISLFALWKNIYGSPISVPYWMMDAVGKLFINTQYSWILHQRWKMLQFGSKLFIINNPSHLLLLYRTTGYQFWLICIRCMWFQLRIDHCSCIGAISTRSKIVLGHCFNNESDLNNLIYMQ